MKSFKEFLIEVPQDIGNRYNYYLADWSPFSPKDNKHGQKIGTFKGHHILGYDHGELFQAVDPKTKLTSIEVRGTPMFNGGFGVQRLSGAVNSPIHGDEFYAHLLRQGHIKTLYSDIHLTPRSIGVWHRLSQNYPDIHVSVYHIDGRPEEPLDPDWESNIGTSTSHPKKSNSRFKARLK